MTTVDLEPFDGPDFVVSLPSWWERSTDTDIDHVALIAVEPGHGELFRANIVVTVDSIDDPQQWHYQARERLAERLHDFLLLDENRDGPASRRLFHHNVPDVGAVTAEQWTWPDGDRGYTLTASAATFDYNAKANLFAAIAATFRPQGG